MEIAVSGLMDLGVGWENLDTALQFYLRFSKYAKSKIIESINERKRDLETTVK